MKNCSKDHMALKNADILHSLLEFVGADQFIFFAPVCTSWRAAWGLRRRRTVTSYANQDTSRSQLRQGFRHSGLPRSSKVCAALAALGKISLIQYALEEGCEWNWRSSLQASRAGHLHVLQWAQKRRLPWNTHVCEGSAEGGHLDLLKWARANQCEWGSRTTCVAARQGHLHVLRWARAKGCPWDSAIFFAAARGGHVGVLEFARQNGCAWNAWAAWGAAKGGHLEALQWAIGNGCTWNTDTCEAAASGGHLGVVQWSVANGCPWNERSCEAAARGGHLGILRWLMSNGCPVDVDKTWRLAAERGHTEVQRWLLEQTRLVGNCRDGGGSGNGNLEHHSVELRGANGLNRNMSVQSLSAEQRGPEKVLSSRTRFRVGCHRWIRVAFARGDRPRHRWMLSTPTRNRSTEIALSVVACSG